MITDDYMTNQARGNMWELLLGDSCERMAEIPDNLVDLSVCSPPFDSLYTYSPSVRDLGNSASRVEFLDHYRFIVEHQQAMTRRHRPNLPIKSDRQARFRSGAVKPASPP